MPGPARRDIVTLRALPTLGAALLLRVACVFWAALAAIFIAHERAAASPPVYACIGGFAALALAWLAWRNARRPDHTTVVLNGDCLTVPVSAGLGRRALTVPAARLNSVEWHDGPGGPTLVLGIPGRFPLRFPKRHVCAGDLARLHAALVARTLPGRRILYALVDAARRPPLTSMALGGLLLLVHLALPADDTSRGHLLLSLGGMNDWLVSRGEFYRLGAAGLLHADTVHLTGNVVLLLILGARLEFVVGGWRLIGAFVTGVLGGNLAAWWFAGHAVLIGSSGGVAAIIGLYAQTLRRAGPNLPTRIRFAPYWFMGLTLAVLLVPVPGTAPATHLGGLVAGIIFGAFGHPLGHVGRFGRIPALAGGTMLLLGLAWGWVQQPTWLAGQDMRVREILADPRASTGALDFAAWRALDVRDPALMTWASDRLAARTPLDRSAAYRYARLLLALGDPEAAARTAAQHLYRGSPGRLPAVLADAELARMKDVCAPLRYGDGALPRPELERTSGHLVFGATRPLMVHALIGRHYVRVPAGVRVATAGSDAAVVILAYGDFRPFRRRARITPSPIDANELRCPTAEY